MRQIGKFLVTTILSLSLFPVANLAQERPKFTKTVLTKDGPVTQEFWGDELLVKLSSSAIQQKGGARYASSFRTLTEATAPPGFDRYGVIPYRGTVEGLQALQSSMAIDPSYEWVSLSPVFRAYQAQSSTTDTLRWGQWQLSENFPGNIGWQSSSVNVDHVYVVFADTGGCFGHEDFSWSQNFWNYNVLDPSKPPVDDQGHGCAVASIVTAKANNGIGIAGIADFVKFGFVKVLDKKGDGDTSTVVNGLLATAAITNALKQSDPHARVILNLSFGAMEFIEPVAVAIRAVKATGVVVVAAAGNNGLNIDRIKFTPASLPEVITVGANGWDNSVAARGFWASNWGPKSVLLAAPGLDVMAAVPKGTPTADELFDSSGYRRVDGTSFAASHVTGTIALMLAKDPELNEDQIRIRLMNTNRTMKPWRLNLRDYHSEELFASAGSLRLDQGTLAEDNVLPAQPYIEVLQAGHSSAQLLIAGTGDDGTNGKPFGVRCSFSAEDSKPQTFEALPWLDAAKEEGSLITLHGNNRVPLQEDSVHQVACQVVDKVGNWSAMSEMLSFQTAASQSLFTSLEGYIVEDGPTSEFVIKFNGNNPTLWHQISINGGTAVWYAGNDELNYRGHVSDSELVSPEIDLRSVTGSVSLRLSHFLQMFGLLMQGTHYDGAEIRVENLDAYPVAAKIVAENLPNSTTFGLEEYALDLSEFAGKRIRLRLRFFTNGSSSVGIGWIVGQIQIKTDVRTGPSPVFNCLQFVRCSIALAQRSDANAPGLLFLTK